MRIYSFTVIFNARFFNYYYSLINVHISVAMHSKVYPQSFKTWFIEMDLFFPSRPRHRRKKLLTSIFIDLLLSMIFIQKPLSSCTLNCKYYEINNELIVSNVAHLAAALIQTSNKMWGKKAYGKFSITHVRRGNLKVHPRPSNLHHEKFCFSAKIAINMNLSFSWSKRIRACSKLMMRPMANVKAEWSKIDGSQ